jgi:hypothetical protein
VPTAGYLEDIQNNKLPHRRIDIPIPIIIELYAVQIVLVAGVGIYLINPAGFTFNILRGNPEFVDIL